ncbi:MULTISPECIES: GntR family transcriptional regulator [Pseudomonas]|uniref:GntR family transcriptional regulator n=1 Tax=Pseudomonas chlororaphis subsp. aurantiaca TaxID=86192 RepID=A0AAJ0ZFG5_9PSED|nr:MULTISPECIES: GntR family transcriptional regulator [Pseudomonas]AZD48631.1 Transcriptional regulator, GntR family [Pseudomonas chlororaphis subsp. aurantiaca]AZD54986.1 Transcriptional regulator, GntR family [Pseudomonas chlororaphis subsp. aurantiaca]AZD67057.1 Transcriptional regulator, GntR family [Pseudomonas chlororaphis subsp. aurantiaca]AZD73531.1 Transcriptional regulator, GntR family [Pseudomonas chlororaphis subsp. aurantiaca]MBU4631556.1 GntR family transcriptional regulator [Ps
MSLSPLQARIARDIVSYVRRERFDIGQHLVESQLALALNVSRTPVKFALNHLVERGMLTHDRNRGFFLARSSDELSDLASQVMGNSDDPLYLQIAELRLRRKIPELFTEIELMRRFDVSRTALRAVLLRIQQEGWMEQRAGQGWRILPMIDSVEAYEESYAFRATIEPAGLLSPTFAIDRETLDACRRQQEYIANGGYLTMTAQELFEANSQFHETLAACSGNRFLQQTVHRLDRLRRLVEYRQASTRAPRKGQAEEHLLILDCLERGDRLAAADQMRKHLEQARRKKVDPALFE